MSKYNILLNILDELRNEAPREYKKYYPALNEIDKLDQTRSRAFIHLFLKVQYGICEFIERENYITHGFLSAILRYHNFSNQSIFK